MPYWRNTAFATILKISSDKLSVSRLKALESVPHHSHGYAIPACDKDASRGVSAVGLPVHAPEGASIPSVLADAVSKLQYRELKKRIRAV